MSLQSACAKIKSSRMITVEHHFVQKLHSSAITLLLLQILTYFSLVAGLLLFLWHHIRTVSVCFIIHNSIATLNNVEKETYLRYCVSSRVATRPSWSSSVKISTICMKTLGLCLILVSMWHRRLIILSCSECLGTSIMFRNDSLMMLCEYRHKVILSTSSPLRDTISFPMAFLKALASGCELPGY